MGHYSLTFLDSGKTPLFTPNNKAAFTAQMLVNREAPDLKVDGDERKCQRSTNPFLGNDPGAKPWYTQRRRVLLNAYIVIL